MRMKWVLSLNQGLILIAKKTIFLPKWGYDGPDHGSATTALCYYVDRQFFSLIAFQKWLLAIAQLFSNWLR
jgi:hypothetical protein